MPNSPQDLHKKVLGKKGETLAEKFLKKQGVKILEKNFRTPFGEADVIAKEGDEILFIEVKTRSGDLFGLPSEGVTKDKKERYYKIAKFYGLKTGEEPNARFDIIEVYDGKKIEWLKNAF
jgi:putative endonuclease